MVNVFGIYISIQGLLALITFQMLEKMTNRIPFLLECVLGIAIGGFLVTKTDVPPFLFILSIFSWGMGSGACKVIGSILLYESQKFFWVLGLNGLLSILFYVVFYSQAELEKGRIVWMLSIYFVVYGFLLIMFGARLKASQD
jgi:uncharacterized membrane protein HdeD (DUF308 family)